MVLDETPPSCLGILPESPHKFGIHAVVPIVGSQAIFLLHGRRTSDGIKCGRTLGSWGHSRDIAGQHVERPRGQEIEPRSFQRYPESQRGTSVSQHRVQLGRSDSRGLLEFPYLTLARVDVDLRVIEEVGACDRPVAARAISGICPRAEFELWYRLSQVVRVSFPEPNQLLEAVPGHHVRGVVHASTGASRFNGE